MKKILLFVVSLFPLWGLGGFSFAQTVTITPVSADYSKKTVTFSVAWQGTTFPENRVWVWIDFCSVAGETPAWFAPATIASFPATPDGVDVSSLNGRGFFVTQNPATVTATLNTTLSKFNWCAYGSGAPPKALLKENGSYELKGTPPFTVNGNITIDDHTFPAGTCITKITDLTGNPAGIDPAVPSISAVTSPTICYNTAANLTATVSGGTTTAMTYTWNIGGSISTTGVPTKTTGNLTTTTTYTVTVLNAAGCTSTVSNTGTITVAANFKQSNPAAASICYNKTATFSLAAATGGLGAITYQWQQSSNSSTWTTATGTSTNAAYTTPALTGSMYYRRVAKSANCGAATTTAAMVTVRPNFTAGSITTASGTTTQGTNPGKTVTNSISASGGNGTISYQWRRTGTSSATLTGSTATYAIGNDASNYAAAGTYYIKRYAHDGTCNTAWTASTGQYTLTVAVPTPPPGAGTKTNTCGTQVWSEPVRIAACDISSWTVSDTSPYCRSYTYNNIKYYYYNWTYVNNNKNSMCPTPWRVPTTNDHDYLMNCLSLALPGDPPHPDPAAWGGDLAGMIQPSGPYAMGAWGYSWSASLRDSSMANCFSITPTGSYKCYTELSDGLQVRCVR